MKINLYKSSNRKIEIKKQKIWMLHNNLAQILVLENQLDSGAGKSTRFQYWTINQILVLDNQPDSGAGQSTGFRCWTINQIPVLDNNQIPALVKVLAKENKKK